MKRIRFQFLSRVYFPMIYFFRNLWAFRKELSSFRPYDYSYNLQIFKRSLIETKKSFGESPFKDHKERILYIERCVELIDRITEDDYWDYLGESVILGSGERESPGNAIKESERIYLQEWNELWDILRGNENPGTGLNNWWD